MPQNNKLSRRQDSLWSRLLESNPQLFREIQGKLKTRNVVIAAAIAVLTQFVSVILLLGQLPDIDVKYLQCGRYGMTLVYKEYGDRLCYSQNDAGSWLINWQLWWLDLFLILSFISIFTLLIVGTYMLVADLVKESERGTLNFIRLTPQSASSILLGKILGVPVLLYAAISLLFPLHLVAGLQAHIPLSLLLAFDLTVIASCAFFYSLALLWSFVDWKISGLKPWVAIVCLGLMLAPTTAVLLNRYSRLDHLVASILLFHPGFGLTYLVDAASSPFGTASFITLDNLAQLSFYGQPLWTKTAIGMGFCFLNFSLWTYWCWALLKRRFHNPERTFLSKAHSYWLTSWLTIVALGFTLQQDFIPRHVYEVLPDNSQHIAHNFLLLQLCLNFFGLGLIYALSPHRQAIQDWMRYRHQTSPKNSLWYELVLGENSPSTIAIALNLAIAILFIAPSIFLILEPSQYYLFGGLLLSATNILLYAVVAQFVLMNKSSSRTIWSIAVLTSLIVLPPLGLGILERTIHILPQAWLFTFFPTVSAQYVSPGAIAFAAFAQWLAISILGIQMTRQLKQAGASETKALMSRVDTLAE